MKKVLIIEDSVMDRKLFVKALEQDEYEILELENAVGIDSRLSISEPDLIILDMHLPGDSGVSLVKKIKELTIAPVLCVSSVFKDEASILKSYADGGVDYLIKPIHPEMLRFKVRNLLAFHEEFFKRLEYQKQTEILARENQFVEMFIANISHELRTPLNGIMGMLDLMNQEDSIPFELESKFEAIFESAEGLHQIVNDILDYTKLKTGNFELSSDTFNLAEVSAGIIGKFQNINRKENVQLLFELEKNLPQFIRFDLLRLKQILNNLVDNAIKFTNEGKVTLSVANKGQHGDSCLIELKVTDTGIGISQDKLPNVFKQFKQLDDSLKKRFGGTGLGLSIVKALVDLSGGEVEVNSIEGIGSQFKVIIPVKIGEEKNELEKGSTKSSFDCRVLLVEDVPTNQIVAKLMLEKIGCSVQVASNGKQGLAMLDAGEFDIVLMDIQMPVMDGIEATKEIRKGKHKDIKILGLSANALMQEVSYYKSIGMDEFMSKPISLNKLLKAFRKLES